MQAKNRIILALDVTDRAKAHDVVEKVREHIDAVKINYPLVLSCGPDMINELSQIKPVICDFKIADIPNTCRLIATNAFDRGATGVIAHAFSGVDSLREIKRIAMDHDGMVFSVVELSHPGAVESYEGTLDRLIDISLRAEVDGFIAPGTRPEKIRYIREKAGKDSIILTPGIGAQGGDARRAIESGGNFVIVGRAIYNAVNPTEVAREIADSLR